MSLSLESGGRFRLRNTVVVAAFVQRLRGGDPAAPRIRKARLPIWKIELPPGAEDTGDRGTIFKAGWTINYLFGHDGEKYIEFYATHRMTNDRRHRIYDSYGFGLKPYLSTRFQ